MKVSRHFFISLLVTLVALAAFAVSASAQSIYGSIRGLVTDPSSAIVANAKVTLINEGTSAERQLRVYQQTGDLRAVVKHLVDETRGGVTAPRASSAHAIN